MGRFQDDLIREVASLRRFAMSLARNRDDAEDLTQDCLVRALEKHHLFAPGTNLRAWLMTIMYNLFISGKRSREPARQAQALDDAMCMAVVPPAQEHHAELRALERALTRLSPDQRDVVLMVAVGGLRYRQAATRLGIPVGTVRSRLARARAALTLQLDGTPEAVGPSAPTLAQAA